MKQSNLPYYRIIKHDELFLSTQNDWHSPLLRGKVRVRVYEAFCLRDAKSMHWAVIHIGIQGEAGMQKEFLVSDDSTLRKKQLERYVREARKFPDPISKWWLVERGFMDV